MECHAEELGDYISASDEVVDEVDEMEEDALQWSTGDGSTFLPSGRTVGVLPAGHYEIVVEPMRGLFFKSVPIKTESLLRLPDTASDEVVDEINMFWSKEDDFARAGLPYKRGILLYGPPGGGKSCTLKLVMEDVHKRGGITMGMDNPSTFVAGMRIFRAIQPETPVVVLMEDVDSTLDNYSETEVLNILDGVEKMHKMVFLATTNYPEKLGARIVNRPSRFDRRFEIGVPNAESRAMYLEHLFGKFMPDVEPNIDRWVNDTAEMSISHLKELFVAVNILDNDYRDAVSTLKEMNYEVPTSGENPALLGLAGYETKEASLKRMAWRVASYSLGI